MVGKTETAQVNLKNFETLVKKCELFIDSEYVNLSVFEQFKAITQHTLELNDGIKSIKWIEETFTMPEHRVVIEKKAIVLVNATDNDVVKYIMPERLIYEKADKILKFLIKNIKVYFSPMYMCCISKLILLCNFIKEQKLEINYTTSPGVAAEYTRQTVKTNVIVDDSLIEQLHKIQNMVNSEYIWDFEKNRNSFYNIQKMIMSNSKRLYNERINASTIFSPDAVKLLKTIK